MKRTAKTIFVAASLSGLVLVLGCGKSRNDKSAGRQLAPLSTISGTLNLVPTGAPSQAQVIQVAR